MVDLDDVIDNYSKEELLTQLNYQNDTNINEHTKVTNNLSFADNDLVEHS